MDRERARHWWPLVAGVGFVITLAAAGCEDKVTAPPAVPTPAPTTPAPTPTPGTSVLKETLTLLARSYVQRNFTTTRRGTLDITVQYSRADSEILLFVTNQPCTYWQFERDECDYLAKSPSGPNPRKLTVKDVAAGIYSLIILNENKERDEPMTFEVVLTSD